MMAGWPDTFVEESNLAQNIFVLRKTLGAVVGDHRYIVTVPGRGYRFSEKVRVIAEEESLVVESHSRSRVVIEESKPRRMVVMSIAGIIFFLDPGSWPARASRSGYPEVVGPSLFHSFSLVP